MDVAQYARFGRSSVSASASERHSAYSPSSSRPPKALSRMDGGSRRLAGLYVEVVRIAAVVPPRCGVAF